MTGKVSFARFLLETGRVCACSGPAPICHCMQQRQEQIRRVAKAAGITEQQAKLAMRAHEENLAEEFEGYQVEYAPIEPDWRLAADRGHQGDP